MKRQPFTVTPKKIAYWMRRFKKVSRCAKPGCNRQFRVGDRVVPRSRGRNGTKTRYYHETCWDGLFIE